MSTTTTSRRFLIATALTFASQGGCSGGQQYVYQGKTYTLTVADADYHRRAMQECEAKFGKVDLHEPLDFSPKLSAQELEKDFIPRAEKHVETLRAACAFLKKAADGAPPSSTDTSSARRLLTEDSSDACHYADRTASNLARARGDLATENTQLEDRRKDEIKRAWHEANREVGVAFALAKRQCGEQWTTSPPACGANTFRKAAEAVVALATNSAFKDWKRYTPEGVSEPADKQYTVEKVTEAIVTSCLAPCAKSRDQTVRGAFEDAALECRWSVSGARGPKRCELPAPEGSNMDPKELKNLQADCKRECAKPAQLPPDRKPTASPARGSRADCIQGCRNSFAGYDNPSALIEGCIVNNCATIPRSP